MDKFLPTWLMIKQHKKTGLKYFCKTTKKDPFKYKGSGVRWYNHLQVHGRDVETLWSKLFTDKEQLMEYAINFSVENNIVESEEWANLVVEDGITGWPPGTKHSAVSIEKQRKNANGFKKGYTPWNKGTSTPDSVKQNQAIGRERYRKENPNWADQCRAARRVGELARLKATSKPVEINGRQFPSASEAARILGLKKTTLIKRVLSPNFKEYRYLSAT